MRVVLLHNDSAGSEDHTDAQLVRLVRRCGHRVVGVAQSMDELTAALQGGDIDLVAVAGGDGTVGRTASELAGWGVPLAILPLGTANNTARCLGVSAKLRRAVEAWAEVEPRRFDLAFLSDGNVRLRFSEAAGWGLFPSVIARAKRLAKPDHPRRTIKRDRRLFMRALECKEPCFYELKVDGRDHSGEYLLVEVANIGLIGPRLEISPQSDPSDGRLEVVMAGESEREALMELIATGHCPRELPTARGTHIELSSGDGLCHRDGGLIRHPKGVKQFSIDMDPAAVRYLA
jgi:diacylglycerol kinase family enzyme